MEFVCETPLKDAPLSAELQRVIAERNVLTTRSKEKMLSALNEIHEAETRRISLRNKAIQEILSSELSYVQQLEILRTFFMEPISSRYLMSEDHFAMIFGHVETVYRVAGALVQELQACGEESLAPAFVRLAPFLKMYSMYACGYHKAINTLQQLRTGRSGATLHAFLQAQESRPEVGCSLQSLLITPVQRLPRYRLLLREVVTHTPPDHPHLPALQDALRGVEVSAAHVDALLDEQEQQMRLVNLQQSLTRGWPQVLSPGRTFITEGSFMKVSKCGTRAIPVQLVLLSDMFLCCRHKFGQLDCRHAFPLVRCSLEKVLGQAVFKVLCGTETLLLFAKNQDEGEQWTRTMSKSIESLKSSLQTLKKQCSRKRLPKRIEDLEEGRTTSQSSLSALTREMRKRKLSSSHSSGSLRASIAAAKKQRDSSLSPKTFTRNLLYPIRRKKRPESLEKLDQPTVRLPRIRAKKHSAAAAQAKKRIPPENENQPKAGPSSEASPEPAVATFEPISWPSQCIELVRHIGQCIKAAFQRF